MNNTTFPPKGQQIVYFIKCDNQYKIGITDNLRNRLSGIKTSNPNLVEVYKWFKVYDRNIEFTLHELFKKHRGRGEWFTLTEDDIRKAGILIKYLNLHVKVNRSRDTVYREKIEDKLQKSKEKLAKAVEDGASQEAIDKKLDKIKKLTKIVDDNGKRIYDKNQLVQLKGNIRKRRSRLSEYESREKKNPDMIQRQKDAIKELEDRLTELTT